MLNTKCLHTLELQKEWEEKISLIKYNELEEDWWQSRYAEWSKDTWGIQFRDSIKPIERLLFARWVKRLGKKFKEQNNIKAMTLAYKILKDYQIYPVKDNEMINTKDVF